jgi:ribosomal protein L37E
MMKDVPVDPEQTVFAKADTVDCSDSFDPEFDAIDNSLDSASPRKPVPADMSIDDLVEAMEENEDDVECRRCKELFDKSECKYDKDYQGWLCWQCQQAVLDHGGDLKIGTAPVDESYSSNPQDQVELEYPELTVTLYGSKRDVDDWDEVEHTDSHVYLVPKIEVATAIWENWITEEDVADVEGGLEALEDDVAWEKFLETHFDDLFEKYHAQILEYFKDEATEDFRERSQEEYQMDQLSSNIDSAYDEWRDERFDESAQKPFLEEFDDAETHKANLTDCPECGTVSYDMKEQYCINCGLNL